MEIVLHIAQHVFISPVALRKEVKFRLLHIQLSLRDIFEKYLPERRQRVQRLEVFLNAQEIVPADRGMVNFLRQGAELFVQNLQQAFLRRQLEYLADFPERQVAAFQRPDQIELCALIPCIIAVTGFRVHILGL